MSLQMAGVIGVAVLAALIIVLRGRAGTSRAPEAKAWTRAASDDADAVSDQSRLRSALDEIAFDRASGKLMESDYLALRATYETALADRVRADDEHRESSATPPAAAPDDAEQLVARARAEQATCPTCGPRPEPSPPYCSNCGLHLRACRACGQRPSEIGARYCSQCGSPLAA